MSMIKCKECGKDVSDMAKSCPGCGCPINVPEGNKCPKCGKNTYFDDVSVVYVPAKTKTSYKANINPLKPLTIADKKEKVIEDAHDRDIHNCRCTSCGYTHTYKVDHTSTTTKMVAIGFAVCIILFIAYNFI